MLPGSRVTSIHEAVNFVRQHGIVAFWPLKNIPIASLWGAVAGDRPVADEHDDPGHITWSWKDSLIGKDAWYYAKLLCRRNFMIRMEIAPCLYALTANFGDYHEDHLIRYEEGNLTFAAKNIYEAILQNGPLDTQQLKKAARLSGRAGDSEFNKAILELQMDMKILPVSISESGAWHYSFVYEIVARHYPEIPIRAHEISISQAKEKLIMTYLASCGITRLSYIKSLFRWQPQSTKNMLQKLENERQLTADFTVEHHPAGDWIGLPSVVLQLSN